MATPTDTTTLRETLRAAHRELLRRTFLGDRAEDMASAVGLTTASVKFIQRSPLFQAALAELQREADAKVVDTAQRMRMERDLVNAAEEGIPLARGAMRLAQNPMVRAKIAFGFLDRAGFGSAANGRKDDPDNYRQIIERLDEMERGSANGAAPKVEITERRITMTGTPVRESGTPATPPHEQPGSPLGRPVETRTSRDTPPERTQSPLEILLKQLSDDPRRDG